MDELKNWMPNTPAKSVDKNPNLAPIWGKSVQIEDKEGKKSKGNENLDNEFGLNSKKSSGLPPRKRKNVNDGVDLNKTPRKRVRMKRHRPKVFDETKPKKPLTPKPQTPKRPRRPQEKKVRLKTPIESSKTATKEAIDEHIRPSCRKKLNFDLDKGSSIVCARVEDKLEEEPKLQLDSCSSSLEKEILNISDGVEAQPEEEPKLQLDSSSFSLENEILIINDGVEAQPEEEPKLQLDSSSFSLENEILIINDEVEAQPEEEPKLQLDSCSCNLENEILIINDEVEDKLEKDSSIVCAGVEDKPQEEPKKQVEGSRITPLKVYRRRFRPDECLKNSRKIGPNCPMMFKKTRTKRRKATLFAKFIFAEISDECMEMPDISISRRPKREANKHLSKIYVTKLRPRNKRTRLLSRRGKKSSTITVAKKKKATGASQKCTVSLNWMVHLKRKRSKMSTPRQDFSSLAIDHSIIQVSEAFLLKAYGLRSKQTEDDKFAACVDIEDMCSQSRATKNTIKQQVLTEDKHMLETVHQEDQNLPEVDLQEDQNLVKVDLQEDQNLPGVNLQEDQNVIGIDHHVLKARNVVEKCMKKMGSLSDNSVFENSCQFRDSTSKSSQTLEQQKQVKVKRVKKRTLESDSKKPDLASPHHEKDDVLSRQYNDAYMEALVHFACKKMEGLNIDDKVNQLMVRYVNGQNALVASKGKFDPSKPQQPAPKVDLDPETMRVWNLLMENTGSEDTERGEDFDKAKYWEEQHEIFRGRIDSFIARMHLIQGDRRFSPWKGSVVDSVCGVFLTQNVSDHLSSSAFMALAAKFPPVSASQHCGPDCTSDCVIHEIDTQNVLVELPESPTRECEISQTMEIFPSSGLDNQPAVEPENGDKSLSQAESTPGKKKGNVNDKQETEIDWDELRKKYSRDKPRSYLSVDTVNWEAVRRSRLKEVAEVIVERGMHNVIAARIKDFLNRMVKDHGSIDLEWLRDVPPDKAKEYLLSIPGLGLKSVECVRLLTLHHHAFPVDVNVGRILVRLGWVPLQPLPEDVQIHLLNQYPLLDTIQKYIWPRLCVRDQRTLYEAHYQLITFGKAFCTKKQPNCNVCPMRGECRHFASAFASARPRLSCPQGQNPKTEPSPVASDQDPMNQNNPPSLLSNSIGDSSEFVHNNTSNCELIGDSSEFVYTNTSNCEPIIEIPPSPRPELDFIEDIEDFMYEPASASTEAQGKDLDDYSYESDQEIPTIRLNDEEFRKNVKEIIEKNSLLREEGDVSQTLVTLTPEQASMHMPKQKYVGRLKTIHQVYELPDSHPLLTRFERREADDPCPYLLAIWATTDETAGSTQESIKLSENAVQGTILIPCRTANRGSFPLNGTYFQVNEVFADQESSLNPIAVPREWIWNLKKRPLFCGTSLTSITRGLSLEEIAVCFRYGFICIRGFDTVIRKAKSLAQRFHLCKTRPVDK